MRKNNTKTGTDPNEYVPPKTRRIKDNATGAVIASVVGLSKENSKLFIPLVDLDKKVRKNNLNAKKGS